MPTRYQLDELVTSTFWSEFTSTAEPASPDHRGADEPGIPVPEPDASPPAPDYYTDDSGVERCGCRDCVAACRQTPLSSVAPREAAPRKILTCVDCGVQAYADSPRGTFSRTRAGRYRSACDSCRVQKRAARREVKRNGRKFGIELEFELYTLESEDYLEYRQAVSSHVVAEALEAAGIAVHNDGYTHEILDDWKIVSDSSVEAGWELVSPPMTWSRARHDVPVICRVLRALDAQPAESCGLHVHHDVTDLSFPAFRRLVKRWHDAQEHTNKLVDENRQYGDWCSPLTERDVARVCALNGFGGIDRYEFDRYKSLNISCFQQYGTVEIRQHESTLDADKILAWVAYGQAIINDSRSRKTNVPGHLGEWIDALPLAHSEHSARKLKDTAGVPDNAVLFTP